MGFIYFSALDFLGRMVLENRQFLAFCRHSWRQHRAQFKLKIVILVSHIVRKQMRWTTY